MEITSDRQSLFAPVKNDSAARVACMISRDDYGMGRCRTIRIVKYRRAVQMNLYSRV
jgi:hypothetical protein